MKDIELARLFGLPTSTLNDWKSKKNLNGNMKFLLYQFISTMPDEIVKERIEAIKLLEDIEVVGTQNFISKVVHLKDKFEILKEYNHILKRSFTHITHLSSFIRRSKLAFMKNSEDSYILLHCYLPYNSTSLQRISYLASTYEQLNAEINIDKIYLVVNGLKPEEMNPSKYFQNIHNLEILDSSYFTKKLYKRKNIVFWNGIEKSRTIR